MLINADFSKRVIVRPGDTPWSPSPGHGVDRIMLDRIGGEVARATSIVRYAAGSHFAQHEHAGGEEFLVLDGTFSDENGHYGPGTYVRNPIGTRRSPFSSYGCTIFIKLSQSDADDTAQFAIDTRQAKFLPGSAAGLSVLPLHNSKNESVALVRWQPQTRFTRHRHWGGEEILVLEGIFQDEYGDYPKGTWIRSPHLSDHQPFSDEGCLIYVKTGHLHEQPHM
jgi:anti-sigma factor ChrR (cupin superfamily)